jgi:SWIM zinc finger
MDEFYPDDFVELPCTLAQPTSPVAATENSVPDRRGKGRNWILLDEFSDAADALSTVPKEHFAVCSTTKVGDGDKVYYRCRHDKNCPYQRLLRYPSNSLRIELYETGEHVHLSNQRRFGIDAAVKERIQEYFKYGVKTPKAILATLRKDGVSPLPTVLQLRNYVAGVRKTSSLNGAITLSDLITLCSKYTSVPLNEDETFILDFSYNLEMGLVNGFQIIFSTKRLLRLAQHARNVHVDGTYKLVYQGYPVLIIGFSDASRSFHPIALSLSMKERLCDYHHLFTVISASIHELFGDVFSYRPNVLISDASAAIKGAFRAWCEDVDKKEIVCWAHVYRNIEKHKHLCSDETIRNNILTDVKVLQLCSSPEIFAAVAKLFLKKYQSLSSAIDFITYIDNSWLKQNCTWFEGYSLDNPSTNNCLEATNNNIKREHTLRKRLGLDDFFQVVTRGIVLGWSIDRRDSEKTISDRPKISLKMWTAAYQWSINPEIKILTKNDNQLVFAASKKLKKPIRTVLPMFTKQLRERKWKTFDQYHLWSKKIFILEKKENLDEYSCTCKKNKKKYTCKHALGVLLRLEICHAPEIAKNVPIGEKLKPGRPPNAEKALIRQ